MKTLGVVGSRSFVKFETRPKAKALDIMRNLVRSEGFTNIVSGGAKGPDQWGEEVAVQFGLDIQLYTPDWETYGKSAGFKRNVMIVNDADLLLIFWDGSSKGAEHDYKLVKKAQKCFRLYVWNEIGDTWELKEQQDESTIIK
jgi:hypothetical protein